MKKITIVLLALLLALAPMAIAKSINFNVDHDANTEEDMKGYLYFYKKAGEAYDYANPSESTDCVITNGLCLPTGATITIPDVPDGQVTTYDLVAQAQDTELFVSEDSNEIHITFNLTPLPVVSPFTGTYNFTTGMVDLTWQQAQADRVTYWDVFVSDSTGGPWEKVDTVSNISGQTDYTTSVEVDAPDGVDTTKYFVVVGFAPYDIHSADSPPLQVDINKGGPDKVINFHIPTTS